MNKKIASLVLSVIVAAIGCGGSSSGGSGTSTGVYNVAVSSAVPASADISIPKSTSERNVKSLTENWATDVTVHAEDTAGNKIGTGCKVGGAGSTYNGSYYSCNITGLTTANLTAGIVVVTENSPPMHVYKEFDATDLTAADAGTTLATSVTTRADMAYAMTLQKCGGSLSSCPSTVDKNCIAQAMAALVSNGSASTSDLVGYSDALLEAHAAAIQNASAGQNPANLLLAAMGGATSGFIGLSGATASKVSVTDALTNTATILTTIANAYCAKADSGLTSTWKDVKTTTISKSQTFDPNAIVGPIGHFTQAEISQYTAESLRGYANAIPLLDKGFQMFGGSNDNAMLTVRNLFRQGAFADSSQASVVVGLMGAVLPTPTITEDYTTIPWTGFKPTSATGAVDNARLYYVNNVAAANFKDANTMFGAFHDVLSDLTDRQSFAIGGGSDFVKAFIANSASFVAADHLATILIPPGSKCAVSAECSPCDTCTNKRCTSNSVKMGVSCTSNSDCDTITICTGGLSISYGGGHCNCTASTPTGTYVFQTAGSLPVVYGATNGYTPPAAKKEGGPCGGPGNICVEDVNCCDPGFTCTDGTKGGVCVGSVYKKGPYAHCTKGSECLSQVCTNGGACTIPDVDVDFDGAENGEECTFQLDCASWYCAGGVCATPPECLASLCTPCATTADCPDIGQYCNSDKYCATGIILQGK